MIFGLFSGTSVAAIKSKVERIDRIRQAVHADAAKALADRAAALEEIRNEILEITSLKARLKE